MTVLQRPARQPTLAANARDRRQASEGASNRRSRGAAPRCRTGGISGL